MEKINKKEVKETLPDSLTEDLFTGAVEIHCKIEGDTVNHPPLKEAGACAKASPG